VHSSAGNTLRIGPARHPSSGWGTDRLPDRSKARDEASHNPHLRLSNSTGGGGGGGGIALMSRRRRPFGAITCADAAV